MTAGPATTPERATTPDPTAARDREADANRAIRAQGALGLLPLALALVAEAAWIAVLAGLLEAFALHAPVTGVAELLVAAVAGLVAARTLGPRLGDAWSRVAVGLAVVAGAVGWLASPEVRALLMERGSAGIGPALAANPGGWLAALAFVRGMAHARLPVDPNRIGTLLAVGVPGLALAAIIGGMITEPWRGTFLAVAQVQVLLFLGSGIMALALARLAQVGAGARIDWRRNPAWLMLLGGLVLATAGIAAWVGAVAGNAIATALSAVFVPLLAVGFIAGFDRRSVKIVFASLVIAGILGIMLRAITSAPPMATPATVITIPGDPNPQASTGILVGVLLVVLLASVAAVALLATLWLRRTHSPGDEEDEERVIDHGGEGDGPRRVRRSLRVRRRPRPVDAVGAYLALMESLAGRDPVARNDAETPAEHAGRLRAAGHGTLALDLLAADVGLARFGGMTLRPEEHRRAVDRSERARATLLRVESEAAPGAIPAASRKAAAPQGPVTRGGRKSAGAGADLPEDEQPGSMETIYNRIRRGF